MDQGATVCSNSGTLVFYAAAISGRKQQQGLEGSAKWIVVSINYYPPHRSLKTLCPYVTISQFD